MVEVDERLAVEVQIAIPKLPAASVLVMDRATFHRRSDTKDAIKAAGRSLEYLPAYSPELNDIGHRWAQAKSY